LEREASAERTIMAEFNVRSDSVNVEQIMEQIRARIREKRGVDYTDAEIEQLAGARLEKFIDPDKLRSSLLQEFHRVRAEGDRPEALDAAVDESVLFETHRPWLRAVRTLLRPFLKLLLNTKALAALTARSKAELTRKSRDQMTFEIIHNMVVEMTRLGIEVKNLTMRVESMQSRLEFNERRARALEGAVVYKPSEPDTLEPMPRPPAREPRGPAEFRQRHEQRHERQDRQERPENSQPAAPAGGQPAQVAPAPGSPESQGQRRRRRRRRGRRGGGAGQPGGMPGAPPAPQSPDGVTGHPVQAGDAAPSLDEHADDAGAEPFGDEPEDGGPGTDSTPQ